VAKLLPVRPEVLAYAQRLGLDPARIKASGFSIEPIGHYPDGRPMYRVQYETAWGRTMVLTTDVQPPL
jgi:hypothetical protein